MGAGDVSVINDNVVFGIPSDGKAFFEDVEDELISIIEIEGQIRHG